MKKYVLYLSVMLVVFSCTLPAPVENSEQDGANDIDEAVESTYCSAEEEELYFSEDYERSEYPELSGEPGDVYVVQEPDGDYKAVILHEKIEDESGNYWTFILTYVEMDSMPTIEDVQKSEVQGHIAGSLEDDNTDDVFWVAEIYLWQRPKDGQLDSSFQHIGNFQFGESKIYSKVYVYADPGDFSSLIDRTFVDAKDESDPEAKKVSDFLKK
jgi:hypothetical protein